MKNVTTRYDQEFRTVVINTCNHLEYYKVNPLLSEEYF